MWRKLVALVIVMAMPAGASAATLREAAEKAAREQTPEGASADRSRTRFWSGVALIGGGALMIGLAAAEVGDDDDGPDDDEDSDESDDGEDSDWGNAVLLGGGIAAAAAGTFLVLTGRRASGPVVSLRKSGVVVRHTIRF
jgi:hypothetical protein